MPRHRFGGRHLVKQGADLRQWRQHHVHDHSFLCALKPGGNAEPFVGDEESLSVGWFDLDDLPTPLAASTSERLELFHTYIENKKHGDATPCSSSMGSSTSGYKVSSL